MYTVKDPQSKELEIKKYNPSESDKIIIKQVYERFDNMKSGVDRKEAEIEWDNAERLTKGEPETVRDEDDWRANVVFNIVLPTILAALQEIIEAPPTTNFKPGGEDDIPKIPILQQIDKYVKDKSDYLYNLMKTFYLALRDGTCITHEYQKEDPREISELVKVNDDGTSEYKKKTINTKIITSDPLSIRDFYVDDMATDLNSARDCIRRFVLNVDEFKRVYSKFSWAKNVDYVVAGGDTTHYEYYEVANDITADDVEILWYYNRPKDQFFVLVNQVLVRDTPLPYDHKELPFSAHYGILNPGHFYGKGFPHLVKDLQAELNTYKNMSLDQSKLDIYKQFITSDRLDIDETDLIPRPGGFIEVPNADGESVGNYIQPLEYGGLKPEVFQMMSELKDDVKRVTGIDDRLQGVASGGTATETAILKETSLKRIRLIMKTAQWGSLKRAAKLKLALIQQFFTQKQAEDVTGAISSDSEASQYLHIPIKDAKIENKNGTLQVVEIDGYSIWEVDPEYIRNNCDVEIDVEPMFVISKPLQQSQLTEDVQVMNTFFPDMTDRAKLFELYLRVKEYPKNLKKDSTSDFPDMAHLARLEDLEMLKNDGTPVPPTQGATIEHTQEHLRFADQMGDKMSKKQKGIFEMHVRQEAIDADIADRQANASNSNDPSTMPTGPAGVPPAGTPTGQPGQAPMGLSKQNVGRPPMSAKDVVPDKNMGVAKL